MMGAYIPMDIIKKVHPFNVVSYAQTTGWTIKDTPTSDFFILHRADSAERIKVPKHEMWEDYYSLVLTAVNQLSHYEKRTADEIMYQLIDRSLVDVVSFTLKGEETETGTTPLRDGLELIEYGRDTLVASAMSVFFDPKPYYEVNHREATDFVNRKVRLGQTELHSFGVRMLLPIEWAEDREQYRIQMETQFDKEQSRKVTSTLLRSVSHVTNSINNKDEKRIIEPEKEDPIVSANLLDALYGMKPIYSKSEIAISIRLASNDPIKSLRRDFNIPEPQFETIKWVSRQLKPKEDNLRKTFIGYVYGVKESMRYGSERDGIAYLNVLSDSAERDEDAGVIRCRVNLIGNYYDMAVRAHQEKKTIRLEGLLNRNPRMSIIDEPSNIKIIEE